MTLASQYLLPYCRGLCAFYVEGKAFRHTTCTRKPSKAKYNHKQRQSAISVPKHPMPFRCSAIDLQFFSSGTLPS
jgi:hypothetical protein